MSVKPLPHKLIKLRTRRTGTLTINGFADVKRPARLPGTIAAVVTLTMVLMLTSGNSNVMLHGDDVIISNINNHNNNNIIVSRCI